MSTQIKSNTIPHNLLSFDSGLSGMVSQDLRVQAAALLPAPYYCWSFLSIICLKWRPILCSTKRAMLPPYPQHSKSNTFRRVFWLMYLTIVTLSISLCAKMFSSFVEMSKSESGQQINGTFPFDSLSWKVGQEKALQSAAISRCAWWKYGDTIETFHSFTGHCTKSLDLSSNIC